MRFHPLVYPFGAALLLTLRYALMIGVDNLEFAASYETAYRIAIGQIPYRDFYTSLPPLSYYSLAGLLAVGKQLVVINQLHLYGWWLLSLLVSYRLAVRWGMDAPAASLVTALVALAVVPPAVPPAYNFAATTLGGIALLLLPVNAGGHFGRLFLVGVLLAITVFTKQNIGIFLTVAIVLGVAVPAWWERGWRGAARVGLPLVAGWGVGLLALSGYWGWYSSPAIVFQQLFLDANVGKGGLLSILLRLVPRLHFNAGTPLLQVAKIVLSIGAVALAARLCWRATAARLEPVGFTITPQSLGVVTGLMTLTIVVTLLPFPPLANVISTVAPALPFHYPLLTQTVYIGGATLAGLHGVGAWRGRDGRRWLITWIVLGALAGHSSSSLAYPLTTAAIAIPGLVYLALPLSGSARVETGIKIGSVVFAITLLIFTVQHYHGFRGTLVAAPADSNFAGLYGAPETIAALKTFMTEVTPRIEGRTIAWFTPPQPNSAFGGIPVRNVVPIFLDSYTPRLEQPILVHYEQSPPDFIYLAAGLRVPATSVAFQLEALRHWLQAHDYQVVWRAGQNELYEYRPAQP